MRSCNTAGFHRLLAHRTYRTSRVFQFLIAFTGTASYQKGPLWWSAHHRHHHLVADTKQDFHSPLTRRFWRAHFGWFLSEDSQETHWKLIANLSKYPELRFLDRYYSLPPIVLAASAFLLGSVLQRYAPALGTSGFQMLVWAFFVSTVVLYHGTFTVNSLAHIFGKRRFATDDNSRNNWFVALITLGEGWHNNHHLRVSNDRVLLGECMSHYTTSASWSGALGLKRTPVILLPAQKPSNVLDRASSVAA